MRSLKEGSGHEDLLFKIGIHEGPCLAVTLNERQDYFGQTVNIAARVQGSPSHAPSPRPGRVVEDFEAAKLLEASGLEPVRQCHSLRGIAAALTVYEIP